MLASGSSVYLICGLLEIRMHELYDILGCFGWSWPKYASRIVTNLTCSTSPMIICICTYSSVVWKSWHIKDLYASHSVSKWCAKCKCYKLEMSWCKNYSKLISKYTFLSRGERYEGGQKRDWFDDEIPRLVSKYTFLDRDERYEGGQKRDWFWGCYLKDEIMI